MATRKFRFGSVVFAALAIVGCVREDDGISKLQNAQPLEIEIVGSGFQWQIRYPGPDGELRTADDLIARRHPHIPANTTTRVKLTSDDYLYSFSVPEFRLKDVAIPEQVFSLAFDRPGVGTYELKGDQFCGFSHPNLSGTVVVESQADFEAWLKKLEPARK